MLIAEFSWFSPSSWWAIAQVVIGLGLVVFVHELGHFLVAKACGVKCDKFYVGFDMFDIRIGDRVIIPRALVKFQWGETEYGVGIVPLGGYVKMLGQDDNPGNTAEEIKRSLQEAGEEVTDEQIAMGLIDRSKMDPRSYLAKSVPQRMAIISAGVVFNLIFAVFFAAIAFRSGVDYTPAVIGNVTPGGPAWQANLAGAELLQIGDKKVEGYFTYLDMAQEIAINGEETPLAFTFRRPGESQPSTMEIWPRKGMIRGVDFALIGVTDALIPRIGDTDPLVEGHAGIKASPPLQPSDLILKVNGSAVSSGYELLTQFSQNRDREIELTVRRDEDLESGIQAETIVTRLPPNPMRETGIVMKWLPVAGIQSNSPAESAGFEVGDLIVLINGQPRGDLFTLEHRMTLIARDAPGPVEFRVLRQGKTVDLSVTPRLPHVISVNHESHPVAIDCLGLAIGISRTVESIAPDSPAAACDILPGDRLKSVEFFLTDKQKQQYPFLAEQPRLEMEQASFVHAWSEVWDYIQAFPPQTRFKFTFQRLNGDQAHQVLPLTADPEGVAEAARTESRAGTLQPRTNIDVELESVPSDQFTLHTRGILLTKLQANYQSQAWSESLALGLKQTIYETKRVGKFLSKLITGKISASNLGGPGTIAMAATSEATAGTSRLLLFLTLLSANLAIVNFLPIPVLDGGHMLFLLYEGIFRRPVSEKAQVVLTYAGLFFILGLMAFVILMDIGRISSFM